MHFGSTLWHRDLNKSSNDLTLHTLASVNEDKNSIYLRDCCSGRTELAPTLEWCGAGFSSHSQVNSQRIMFQMYNSTVILFQFHFFFPHKKREFSFVRSLGFQASSLDPHVNNDPCRLYMLMSLLLLVGSLSCGTRVNVRRHTEKLKTQPFVKFYIWYHHFLYSRK